MTTRIVKKQYFTTRDVLKALGFSDGAFRALRPGYDSSEEVSCSGVVVETIVDQHTNVRED